jgi:hypothetical protein
MQMTEKLCTIANLSSRRPLEGIIKLKRLPASGVYGPRPAVYSLILVRLSPYSYSFLCRLRWTLQSWMASPEFTPSSLLS